MSKKEIKITEIWFDVGNLINWAEINIKTILWNKV